MNQRFAAFLAVARTLSIRKAAEEGFVSYQCINGHIRSLEEAYKVRLFDRSPSFALTADGQVLLEALNQIKQIEDNLSQSFFGQGKDVVGQVKLGVPMSRYTEIVPPIFAAFHEEYPRADLQIIQDYSNVLQQQVERGLLDMAIAVQQPALTNAKLNSLLLLQEKYLFLVSAPLLMQIYGEEWELWHQKFKKRGIPLKELSRFPIVSYPKDSRFRKQMDHAALDHGLSFQTVFSSNRAETFDAIARTNIAGCIISHQLYGLTDRKNRHMRKEHRLRAYRIDWGDIQIDSDIMLIRQEGNPLAPFKQHLIQMIQQHFKTYDLLVRKL